MIEAPIVYVKDKQAFAKIGAGLQLLGPAVESIKKLSKKYSLFHIVDLDLKKGDYRNFDVYDKLTYTTHIQVECEEEKAIKRLVEINARAVVPLPTSINLKKFNRRLLVGVVSEKSADVSDVNDVIVESNDEEIIENCRRNEKRIMMREEKWDKKTNIWAIILPKP